jgi:hypothetical protein
LKALWREITGFETSFFGILRAGSLRGDSIADGWSKLDLLRDFGQTNEQQGHFNE